METIEAILSSDYAKDACHCKRCRLDIAAIVLNYLPPSYVVTYEDEVKKRLNASIVQYRADIVRELGRPCRRWRSAFITTGKMDRISIEVI